MTAIDALFALFAPAVVLFVAGWVATLVIVFLWCVKEQVVAAQAFYDRNGGTQARLLGSSFR
jgi:hypothetical protein